MCLNCVLYNPSPRVRGSSQRQSAFLCLQQNYEYSHYEGKTRTIKSLLFILSVPVRFCQQVCDESDYQLVHKPLEL